MTPALKAALVAATFFWAAPSLANPYQELASSEPFAKPIAIENLHKKIPGIPNDVDGFLPKIKALKYTFERMEQCTVPVLCDHRLLDKPHYLVRRSLILDISAMDTAFSEGLRVAERHACSDLKFSNARRQFLTDIQLGYIAELTAHERYCGDLPGGGSWSYDIASASGNITTSVQLKTTPPDLEALLSRGVAWLEISPPTTNITNKDLLGFINPNSVLGQVLVHTFIILNFKIEQQTFHTFDTGWSRIEKFLSSDKMIMGATYSSLNEMKQIPSISYFLQKTEEAGKVRKNYVLDTTNTSFRSPEGKIILSIANFDLVPEIAIQNYYTQKKFDIDLLDSLDDEFEHITIKPKDNLWSLTKEKYGIGGFYYLVANFNKLRPHQPLQPNQRLVLPPLWALSPPEAQIITAGDSLWKIWKAQCPKQNWSSVINSVLEVASDPDHIYPLQVLNICKSGENQASAATNTDY